jgi:HEAT repeat protein
MIGGSELVKTRAPTLSAIEARPPPGGLAIALALLAGLWTFAAGPATVMAAPRAARAGSRRDSSAGASSGGTSTEVVDLLLQLLAAGTSTDRTVAALGALTKLGDPRALELLELYAGHRRTEVRCAAVSALAPLGDPRASAVLLERLGDETPEVRAAAAAALAARKETAAVPRLVRLVRRGDVGAAVPAGALATPEGLAELCGMQGGAAEPVLAAALGSYLKRTDVADDTRIEPLRAVAKLHGVEATAALTDYLSSIPPHDTRSSRREAQRLLDERGADR